MNWPLIRVESRKVWRWYVVLLGLAMCLTTACPSPLARDTAWVGVLAAAHGFLLAWRLFADPGGSASFLWSRPMMRRTLFLHRWLAGLACLSILGVMLFAVIGGGARAAFQEAMGNSYPGVIRWHELNALWPAILCSLLAYQLTLMLRVQSQLFSGMAAPVQDAVLRWACIVVIGGGAPMGLAVIPAQFKGVPPWTAAEALAYVAITTVLTTGLGLWAYEHVEVEA